MGLSAAYTKQQFLEFIAKQIDDNEIVVISDYISNIEYKKRANAKQVNFNFPAVGFEHEDSVVDVLDSKKVGVIIMKRKWLDEDLLREIDKNQNSV